jgi:hypothetical protein
MVEWFLGLQPPVQAAVVSGLVAVGVSVVGLLGALVAQGISAKTAHKNALKLFKEQTADQLAMFHRQIDEQNRVRAEDSLDRRRTTLLAAREDVYVTFMRLARRYWDTFLAADYSYNRLMETRAKGDATDEIHANVVESSALEMQRIFPQLEEAFERLSLHAPNDVQEAATSWYEIIVNAQSAGEAPQVADARYEFIRQARLDVGAEGPLAPEGDGLGMSAV